MKYGIALVQNQSRHPQPWERAPHIKCKPQGISGVEDASECFQFETLLYPLVYVI